MKDYCRTCPEAYAEPGQDYCAACLANGTAEAAAASQDAEERVRLGRIDTVTDRRGEG